MPDTGYRQLRTSRANDVLGTISRTFSYIGRHYRLAFITAIVLIMLSSLTTVASSYMFTPIINRYIIPYIGVEDPDLSGLRNMVFIMIAVYMTGLLSSYGFTKLISIVSTGTLNFMRQDLFRVMEKLPPGSRVISSTLTRFCRSMHR